MTPGGRPDHLITYDITRYYERLCERMPAKKAMIATTVNKLLRVIYWMLKKDLTFANCMAEGSAQFKGCRRKADASTASAKAA